MRCTGSGDELRPGNGFGLPELLDDCSLPLSPLLAAATRGRRAIKGRGEAARLLAGALESLLLRAIVCLAFGADALVESLFMEGDDVPLRSGEGDRVARLPATPAAGAGLEAPVLIVNLAGEACTLSRFELLLLLLVLRPEELVEFGEEEADGRLIAGRVPAGAEFVRGADPER